MTTFTGFPIIFRFIFVILFFLIIEPLKTYAVIQTDLPIKEIAGQEYYVYEVKNGESIYGIAKKFDWNIDELMRLNPESLGKLNKGKKLYYLKDSKELNNSGEISLISQSKKEEHKYHIVKKGENIYSISKLYNISPDVIYSANPNAKKGLKIGDKLIFPSEHSKINETEEINFKQDINESFDLPTDMNSEILAEIESDVEDNSELVEKESDSELVNQYEKLLLEGVKIALILDNPNSKRDIDFLRGFLIAISEIKDNPYKLDLKVIDGRISTYNLLDTIQTYEPSLIISTADKAFPAFLADYGNTKNVAVINVFDLKNELYEDNPSIIQLLSPTSFYADQIVQKLYNENKNRQLISVGDRDENDAIGLLFEKSFQNDVDNLSLEELEHYVPEYGQPLTFYSHVVKKEDILLFLNLIKNIKELYPDNEINIIGRSNWSTYAYDLKKNYGEHEVIIPMRVWLDEDTPEWEKFVTQFENLFIEKPVKSLPNFAATGYDVANYFLQHLFLNVSQFDDEIGLNNKKPLQNDIKLIRLNNMRGGLINTYSYLLKFHTGGIIEKITLQ